MEITLNTNEPLTREIFLQGEDIYGIDFGEEFNHPIEKNILGPKILSMTFGSKFNSPIHELPIHLEYLDLESSCYVGPLPKILPLRTLRCLFLGPRYNHPLNLKKAKKIETVKLGEDFNQDLSQIKCSCLIINSNFINPDFLNQQLPNDLIRLHLSGNFNQVLPNLPQSLKVLIIGKSSIYDQKFQSSMTLETLQLLSTTGKHVFDCELLPQSLIRLTIGPNYPPILNLPPSLKYLHTFQAMFVIVSENLEELFISSDYIPPNLHDLKKLRVLYLGPECKQPLPRILPPNLKSFAIGPNIQIINNSTIELPPNLLELAIPQGFPGIIPRTNNNNKKLNVHEFTVPS